MLPFDHVVPEKEKNPKLPEELVATEAEGILAWAVRGFADWQRNGLQSKPKETLAIDEYRIEADHIHQWDAEVSRASGGCLVEGRGPAQEL